MFKRILAWVLIGMCLTAGVQAGQAPYTGYYYDSWGEITPGPNIYVPEAEFTSGMMGLETPLSGPCDLYADEKSGCIYIADTGNSRIVVLDGDMRFAREYAGFRNGEAFETFNNPRGISLDQAGNLVVADTANGQVLRIAPDGTLLGRYTRPESELYPAEIMFQPVKAASDLENNIYALVPSVYQGIVLFSEEGEFLNFFGSNTVNITASLLFDYYWKKLLSQEQAEKMARYVPINYLSMDMDKNGYMYVTLYSDSSKKQIKKLNAMGNDILRVVTDSKARYGDLDVLYLNGTKTDTQLADIAVKEDGLIYALDSSRGRVFIYSQGSDSLGVFGGSGRQTGLFTSACAIDLVGEAVCVLDTVRATITSFVPTSFGSDIIRAVDLYEEGRYDESEALWRALLTRSCNLELAWDGIGKAMLARHEYKNAMAAFEKANDTYWYSKAFTEYRVEAVRGVISEVLIGAAVLAALWLALRPVVRRKRAGKERKITPVRLALRSVLHPISGFEEIRTERAYSPLFAVVALILWFFLSVVEYQYAGFLFNGRKPDSINVLLLLAKTVGLFWLIVIVNNALATFMDGESTFRQLWVSAAYCLLPLIAVRAVCLILSHVLTLDEAVIHGTIGACGYVWLLWQVICMLKTMQQYTFQKTILNLALTVAGLLIVLFIAFLFFSLVGQVWSFVHTIFDEIMLWD